MQTETTPTSSVVQLKPPKDLPYRVTLHYLCKKSEPMKRRVFVTGGAHGIGRAIVEAFARRGDKVTFCDIDSRLGAQTAAETGARFCEVDVTDA